MAANYYKLKGKVWGEKKDKQNTHSYTRVMAVWLMEIKKKKKIYKTICKRNWFVFKMQNMTCRKCWIVQRVLPADLIMGHKMNVPLPMNPVTCTSVERGGQLLMNKAAAAARLVFSPMHTNLHLY